MHESKAHKVLMCKGLSPDGPLSHVRNNIMYGVKFHAGTDDDLPTPPVDMWTADWLRLPYPLTVLEFSVAGKDWLLALSQCDDQAAIDCAVLSNIRGSWDYYCSFDITPDGVALSSGAQRKGIIADGHDKERHILLCGCANAVLAFLLALRCSNVEQKVIAPSQLKRQIYSCRGVPAFEYRVLTIKPRKQGKDSVKTGQSHASPRLHWRRGHVRRLPGGNLTWVTSCMVGDAAAGVIDKDYRVKR